MEKFLHSAKERFSAEIYDKIALFCEQVNNVCKTEEQQQMFKFGLKNTQIIFPLELDFDMVFAGILLPLARQNLLEKSFEQNKSAMELVSAVLKIEQLDFDKDSQVEDIRSMLVAMAKDIRVIILKLADTLNTARHSKMLDEAEKEKLHRDIVNIYVPLASRLGISYIKSELQDLDLLYTQPTEYKKLMKALAEDKNQRQMQMEQVILEVKSTLQQLGIKGDVYGRLKHVSSVYAKIYQKNHSLSEIYDLSAIRVLVQNINECYSVLGIVHTKYQPMDGRFKDYIAKPKSNGYQSLHTTVLIDGKPLEIQIRTFDMHLHAEYGIAAHFLYKEQKKKSSLDDKLIEIKKLLENPNLDSAKDIISQLKTDVYSGEIFVQTPMGKIINLPQNSTPIDFAYAIHSKIGNKCVGARINSKMMPLGTKLNNGDVVEIITNPNAKGPSRDWLNMVATSGAKNKINHFFKKEMRDENIKKGKLMLEQSAKLKNLDLKQLLSDTWMDEVFERYSLKTIDDMYAMIGSASLTSQQVLNKLVACYNEHNKVQKTFEIKQSSQKAVEPDKSSIAELKNMLLKYANCCSPIPGDEIVGFISRGRGVTVHKTDCKTLEFLEKERLMPLNWSENTEQTTYVANLKVVVKDSSGSLAEIVNKISEQKLNLAKIQSQKVKNQTAIIDVGVYINNTKKLNELITKLSNLENVFEVYRGEK